MMKTISPVTTGFSQFRLHKVRSVCRRLTSRDSLDITLLIIAAGMGLLMTVGLAIPALWNSANQPALGPAVNPAASPVTSAVTADSRLVIDNPIR